MIDSAKNTKGTLDSLIGLGNTLRNNRSFSNIITGTSDLIDQAEKTAQSYKKTYESLKNTTAQASSDLKKLAKTINSTKYGNKLVTSMTNRYNKASNKAKNLKSSISTKVTNKVNAVTDKVKNSSAYKRVSSNKYVKKYVNQAKGALTKDNLKILYGDSKTALGAAKSVIETTGNAKDTANSAKSMYSNLKNKNYVQAAKDGASMINSGYKTATSGYKAMQDINKTLHTKTV